jgi:SAM-dependent methyltransferase
MPRTPDRTKSRQDWEDLGRVDAQWAILSRPDKRQGKWESSDFFASGRKEVDAVLGRAAELGLLEHNRRALDVGCGIGRLSIALADHFDEVVGVDISSTMLDQARDLHGGRSGLRFEQAPANDLSEIADNTFDLVCTKLVLQHLPSQAVMLQALDEMLRVLVPGGLLVAQTTSALPLRHRLQPRSRVYRALRRTGLSADVLYERLHLQPIRMTALPVARATERLRDSGAHVHEATTELKDADVVWTTYWATA